MSQNQRDPKTSIIYKAMTTSTIREERNTYKFCNKYQMMPNGIVIQINFFFRYKILSYHNTWTDQREKLSFREALTNDKIIDMWKDGQLWYLGPLFINWDDYVQQQQH